MALFWRQWRQNASGSGWRPMKTAVGDKSAFDDLNFIRK
jgi:hypothetical protein